MESEKQVGKVTGVVKSTQMRTTSQLKDRSANSSKPYRETSQSYREKPATPNSPSGSSVTTMYDHLLSPPSPEEEEKDDRLRNDLLDEICNDMGIDDSMDLDFDDFCCEPTPAQLQKVAPQRLSNTPSAKGESEVRRSSISTASSGYATSDSLCAIAKLTQSITPDGPNLSTSAPLFGTSGNAEDQTITDETSQDSNSDSQLMTAKPESLQQSGCCDEDFTEMAAASDDAKCDRAAKAAAERQRAEFTPYTVPGNGQAVDVKRRRNTTEEENVQAEPQQSTANNTSSQFQQQASTSTAPGPWQQQQPVQPTAAYNNTHQAQQQQRPATCDYSYSEDFTMEDLTPDTTINFSEMPQPANYYQLPQSANDNLSLNFSMSLNNQAYNQQTSSGPVSLPNQFTQCRSANSQGNGTMSPQRSQPQMHPFQGPGQMQHQTAGSPFQQPQQAGVSTSAPASMQPTFTRQESFPSSAGSMPQSPASHQQQNNGSMQGGSTPPQTPSAQKPGANAASAFTSQQGFMQRLVTDKSSAFRSHPLFPLLRDLIIADMNFHEPSFPHKLIRDLPSDFNKLLKNYLSRNPPRGNYQSNQSVESVVMDALKYAHHTLIEKIQQKKTDDHPGGQQHPGQHVPPVTQAGQPTPAPATSQPTMSNINEYCSKFDDSVRQDMASASAQQQQQQSQGNYGRSMHSPGFRSPVHRPPMRTPLYPGDMGMPSQAAGSTAMFNQPLTVDTGANVPSQNAAPPMNAPAGHMGPPQQPGMYQQTPAHYNQQSIPPQGSFGRPHPGQRNAPFMQGPACPPPNYTVSPSNPPVPRQHQGMYDMYGQPQHDGSYDQSGYCMPPPPPAHNRGMHTMGNQQMMQYMNNVNDCALMKTVMGEGRPDLYGDGMSDNSSVMSSHSMQGSTKGQQQGQGKTPEGRKHASLPKEAVNIMLNWLREHQDKPYPNDDEKGMLIKQTGLSITQINYWFTNARRRLLPKWRGEDM